MTRRSAGVWRAVAAAASRDTGPSHGEARPSAHVTRAILPGRHGRARYPPGQPCRPRPRRGRTERRAARSAGSELAARSVVAVYCGPLRTAAARAFPRRRQPAALHIRRALGTRRGGEIGAQETSVIRRARGAAGPSGGGPRRVQRGAAEVRCGRPTRGAGRLTRDR